MENSDIVLLFKHLVKRLQTYRRDGNRPCVIWISSEYDISNIQTKFKNLEIYPGTSTAENIYQLTKQIAELWQLIKNLPEYKQSEPIEEFWRITDYSISIKTEPTKNVSGWIETNTASPYKLTELIRHAVAIHNYLFPLREHNDKKYRTDKDGKIMCGLGSNLSKGVLIAIHSKFNKEIESTDINFVATFTNEPLTIDWNPINWKGYKGNLRYFVELVSGKKWAECKPSLINKYFTPQIDSDGQTKPLEIRKRINACKQSD